MEEQHVMKDLVLEDGIPQGDMLETIFYMQKSLSMRFFDPELLTIEQQEFWSMQMYLAMVKECGEVIDWHNWKHWKTKRKKPDVKEIEFELVDILHFLVEWMLIWKITPLKLFQLYKTKYLENQRRWNENY